LPGRRGRGGKQVVVHCIRRREDYVFFHLLGTQVFVSPTTWHNESVASIQEFGFQKFHQRMTATQFVEVALRPKKERDLVRPRPEKGLPRGQVIVAPAQDGIG